MRKLLVFAGVMLLLSAFAVSQTLLREDRTDRDFSLNGTRYSQNCLGYELEQLCLAASGGLQTVDYVNGLTVVCSGQDERAAKVQSTVVDVRGYEKCLKE